MIYAYKTVQRGLYSGSKKKKKKLGTHFRDELEPFLKKQTMREQVQIERKAK